MSDQRPIIFDTTYEQFKEQVLDPSHQQPVLVDIWAEWCSPCLALAPVLEKVLPEFEGRVRLAKVDADEGENMKLAGHYRVRGFPTVLMFIDGEEVDRFASARPAQYVREFIEQHLHP